MTEEHYNALPAGYTLHEYTIKSVLGHGGFGITYLAADENLGIDVAIKEYLPAEFAVRQGSQTVRPRSTGDEEDYQWGLDRFMLEAQTLALFRHPAIVPVFRFFRENGTAYMVMEYQKGDSLASLMRKHRGEFTEDDLMGLVRPVLEGLAEVHKAGYLHRDVKPGNIFIRENGTPVLLDFGAARSAVGRKSKNLTSIVTPGYAPLEQYFADGNQGPWTDIYSLAAILYQAVAGRIPPEAPARVKKDPINPAAEVAKGKFSAPFLEAIDQALVVEEEDRPQTTGDWLAMLTGERPAVAPGQAEAEALEPAPDATIIAGGFGGGRGAGTDAPLDPEPEDRPAPSFRRAPSGAPAETPVAAATIPAASGDGGGTGVAAGVDPDSEPPRRRGRGLKVAAIAAAAVFLVGLSAAGAWLVIQNQEQTELADKRKQEEIERLKREEAKRKAAEEAKRRAAEDAKRKAQEEARRRAQEEAKRKATEEAKRKAAEEEARRKAEAEAKRKAQEEARRKAEEEARRKAEAERQRQLEEARRKAEEERKRKLEEARRNETERERQRRLEEERQKAEEERKRKLEEARRNQAEEERKRAEEEKRRKAAEEAKRKAEEEKRRKAAEARRKAAEEARRKNAGRGVSCPGSLGRLNGLYASRRECFFVFRVFSNALTTGSTGSTSQWRNSRSGSRGTLTILRSYQRRDGVYCRRFQQTIITGKGVSRRAVGTACLFNSRWKITAG